MHSVYLCGNTGGINRGCEAIVRSSAKILRECGIDNLYLMTFNRNFDESIGLNKIATLIDYPRKTLFQKALSCFVRKFLRNGVFGGKYLYKPLFSSIDKNSFVMSIGGDVYCYGAPYGAYALNELANSHSVPSVFWGCSVDERILSDKKMQEDVNGYSYIIVRESLSYNMLKQVYNNTDNLILACDPAFHLDKKPVELPENFKEKNTVGINLSPLVFSDVENTDDIMYKNVFNLIDYIIGSTDYSVCLIPHVYSVEDNLQDYYVLKRIYDHYPDCDRICIVDEEYSCEELKYIISNCRFFIGARTHSMIAAYSTGVPAFALSYSIKSKGIAKDLFDDYKKYCISYRNIKSHNELKNAFCEVLVKEEENILNRYNDILDNYKSSILTATPLLKGLFYE